MSVSIFGRLRIALTLALFGQHTAFSAVRIEGEIQFFAHPAQTNTAPFKRLDFTLTLDDCRWNIQLTNYSYRDYGGPLALNYSTDCGNSRSIFFWSKQSVEAARIRETKRFRHLSALYENPSTETVQVHSGNHPKGKEADEIAPWIGFCLPLVLKTNAETLIPNVLSTLAWPTNQLKCVLEVDGSGGFSKRVWLWKPGFANRAFGRKVELVNLPSPLDSGYVGLSYEVTSWDTNNNPRTFVQTTYSVDAGVASPKPLPASITVGRIKSIKQTHETLPPLSNLPPSAAIVDYRTNVSDRPLTYKNSEFNLLNPGEPDLTDKTEAIKQDMLRKARTSQ